MVRAAVLLACLARGGSLRTPSHRMPHLMEQTPAFSRECVPFPNKRVIMVTPNLEYWAMFLNWYHYAKRYMGSADQLVVVAQDPGIVPLLQNSSFVFMDLNGTLNQPAQAQSLVRVPHPYNSMEFNSLTMKRPSQILYFLKLNCTVLYSDTDAVWLGDVFQDIAEAGSHDMYVTDDTPNNTKTKDEWWWLCTSFLYLQPSPTIREFVQQWIFRQCGSNDQMPFNTALRERQSVDFAVLPYEAFPPGCSVSRFWGNPTMHVLHANWMIGLEKKTQFLAEHQVWAQ